jgi:diadenosine tetraphosphate (Ap4A) HIT family hydrolase
MTTCSLCLQDGGEVLFRDQQLRVVLVDDAHYPGFCRVIWQAHVKEMTDLAPEARARLMAVLWEVEAALIESMAPDKVNLASLGNMTPHLHWHLIPRFVDDAHFPEAIWAPAQRPGVPPPARVALLPALRAAIVRRLASV